jgi:hypothetical protein
MYWAGSGSAGRSPGSIDFTRRVDRRRRLADVARPALRIIRLYAHPER